MRTHRKRGLVITTALAIFLGSGAVAFSPIPTSPASLPNLLLVWSSSTPMGLSTTRY